MCVIHVVNFTILVACFFKKIYTSLNIFLTMQTNKLSGAWIMMKKLSVRRAKEPFDQNPLT